ncbi:response regulator [bacterium]|nr:response regulator [bacterium]
MAKILVIDDEESFRGFMVALLEDQGYETQFAQDGEEGMELVRKQHFDLVITDIIIPLKDGFEVCKEILANYPRTEVIAMSGAANDYLKTAAALGVKYTFGKPFDVQEFLAVVKQATHNSAEDSG